MDEKKRRVGRPNLEVTKESTLCIRMDAELARNLEYYCKAHNTTRGEVVRQSLVSYLSNKE